MLNDYPMKPNSPRDIRKKLDEAASFIQVPNAAGLELTNERKLKLQTRNILLQAMHLIGRPDCNHLCEKGVKV